MTAIDLTAIRERLSKIGEGDWSSPLTDIGSAYFDHDYEAYPNNDESGPIFVTRSAELCDFLTHAPDDIRSLLAALESSEAENKRLREATDLNKHFTLDHRPSYAALCLYEGEISLGKYCEWVSAYAAGNDMALPDGVMNSGGMEETPKELKLEIAAARKQAFAEAAEVFGDYELDGEVVRAKILALSESGAEKETP